MKYLVKRRLYIDVNSVINLGKSKTCPFECQYVTLQYRLPLLASIFHIANVQAQFDRLRNDLAINTTRTEE